MPTDIENAARVARLKEEAENAARVARLKEEAENAAQKNPEPDSAPEPGSDQDDLFH